ncbi:MAG: hypothetical protein NTW96_21450 [Planctomycetia bacterium]|nr:hypothetical protein [Planctomycetia bacterium]
MRTALFLQCVLMVCGALPALAQQEAGTAASDAQSSQPVAVVPIAVGGEKQLFIDNRFIAADSRNVELCMNPPVKLGAVLRPERPWEDKSIGFCASVIEHEGVFKLFYRADGREKGASVCLATSRDGLQWERPRIGLYEHGGTKDNNIVFRDTDDSAAYRGVGETVVFLDPHGSAEQRFKMIASKGWPDPRSAGLYCHTSPDGVHWTAGPRVLDICPDTANQAAWDRQRGKYVAYIRIWNPLRKVGRVEMDDIMAPWLYKPLGAEAFFIWGKESVAVPSREFPVAFGYDAEDPVPSDHYNPAAVEYPYAQNAYFAFPSPYMHFPEPPAGKFGNDGLLDIQMAVSRDGVEYRRMTRAPYIPLGLAGEPDSLSNYMAVGMVRRGDYLYQYYGAYAVTHGLPEAHQKLPIGCLCAVRQRLDGFVSADAAWGGGELVTPPVVFTGKRLVLNLNASAMGACQVGLLDAAGKDVPGFTVDACDILRGNAVEQVVTWKGSSDLAALSGQPVRLKFVMRAAKLFAFQFADGPGSAK